MDIQESDNIQDKYQDNIEVLVPTYQDNAL